MFCSKCGYKIDENHKFCGKCGAKIEKEASTTSSTNASNLDSFIGNISKTTDKQSVDSDIFSKVEEVQNDDKDVKNKKKKKSLFQKKTNSNKKANTKKKAKIVRPKQKVKAKKKPNITKNKSGKKLNLKILLPAIIIPIIILIGVLVFIFFINKSSNPTNSIAKAIKTTYERIDEYSRKVEQMPDFSINKSEILSSKSDVGIIEKEQYLKIKDSSGGLLNENVLGSIKGMSVKYSEKQDVKSDLFDAKLSLANEKDEEIFAKISSSPELVTLSLPSLYHNNLGMHFKQDESENALTITTAYYDKVLQLLDLLKNSESSFNIFKESLKDKLYALVNDIIKNSEITVISEEESIDMEYSIKIDDNSLLEAIKAFLNQVKEDDFYKKLQILYSEVMEEEALDINSIDMLIASIDKTIKASTASQEDGDNNTEVEVHKTEIRLVIDENQIIRNVGFDILIDGVNVDIKTYIDDLENKLSLKANIKMSKSNSSLTLDMLSSIEKLNDDMIRRVNNIDLTTFEDEKIILDSNTNYNLKTKAYENKIDVAISDNASEFIFNYDLSGNYKEESDTKKLDINSLKINFNDGLYHFDFEFIGHILKRSTDTIYTINSDAIFIDNMSDEEINEIKEEINKNWEEFLDRFRTKKW